MQFSLKNKFIAITGCGNGIGRAASIMLANGISTFANIPGGFDEIKKFQP